MAVCAPSKRETKTNEGEKMNIADYRRQIIPFVPKPEPREGTIPGTTMNLRIGNTVSFHFDAILDEAYSSYEELHEYTKIQIAKDSIPLEIYTEQMGYLYPKDDIDEQKLFREYLEKERVVNGKKYKENYAKMMDNCRPYIVGGIVGGTVTGLGTGAGMGALIGLAGGPLGAMIGMFAGMAIGGGVGGHIGAEVSINGSTNRERVFKTNHFVNYINFKRCMVIDDIFTQFLHKNEYLADCVCPLSKNLFYVPTLAPNGFIYEWDEIVGKILEAVSGNPLDDDHPFMISGKRRPFAVNDLRIDADTLYRCVKKVERVVDVEIHKLKHHQIITKNLTTYLSICESNFERATGEMLVKNLKTYQRGQIPRITWDDTNKEIQTVMGLLAQNQEKRK